MLQISVFVLKQPVTVTRTSFSMEIQRKLYLHVYQNSNDAEQKEVNVCYLPGKLVLLDVEHGVFNRLVHKRIHAGYEELNCTKQRLSIFGQKLLGVSIVTKLILEVKFEDNTITHTKSE